MAVGLSCKPDIVDEGSKFEKTIDKRGKILYNYQAI